MWRHILPPDLSPTTIYAVATIYAATPPPALSLSFACRAYSVDDLASDVLIPRPYILLFLVSYR